MSSLAHLSEVAVEQVKLLSGRRGEKLRNAGIGTVADLLQHVPRRYIDRSRTEQIATVPVGREVTIIGTVQRVSTRRPRRNLAITEAVVSDESARITVVWFNQAFRERQLSVGAEVALSGKVESFRGRLQMKSPDVDLMRSASESLVTGRVVPVYPSAGGLSSGYLRRAIHNALGRARPIDDPLPSEMVRRLGLIDRDRAISDIHFPETPDVVAPARRRLVFDELFRLEVALALSKRQMIEEAVGIAHGPDGLLLGRFIEGLPFTLTSAQGRVIDEIGRDMQAPHPMHRLLLGEVGSGKTVVAVSALMTGVEGGYQGAVMAPTEVLAVQHYLSITALLAGAGLAPPPDDTPNLFSGEGTGVKLALLTSSNAEVNFRPHVTRDEVVELVAEGAVDIVVGTHALIQEGVRFAALGVAVIDEQHRFGVHQRVLLKEKADDADPDLLIMTATPIPRTLSMTLYGDLDVSLLDEMPPGRPEVLTLAVRPDQLSEVYDRVRTEASAGRQTFVVCPLVEDSPKVQAASATAEYERLQGVFPDLRLGLLHGQLRSVDKQSVMQAFRDGALDVLVTTTVIEVGIDIPNSTIMVIEDADRFGLSQLHQLRGRLARHAGPNWCYLVADPSTEEGRTRIEAMVAIDDGFELAEIDLRIRGQGTVFGARQSGLSDLRLSDILRDKDELVAARREAFTLVDQDPDLSDHPDVRREVRALLGDDVEWLFRS
ncbi:MAG: ATP-dependent DNA helicase RecG [Gammaproteobacteria bacterium]|nr:ATP-dependent DNA helicase RecG [Gammaproteobacteria bacterium]